MDGFPRPASRGLDAASRKEGENVERQCPAGLDHVRRDPGRVVGVREERHPGSGGSSGPTAQAGTVTIGARSVPGVGTVLVDAKGFTLYDLASEASGKIVCTGSCASTWPPLLLPAGVMSATPQSGISASKLGKITRPDGGTQVTYGDMPLYLFVGDQSPGQANGQGVAGFQVVTPSG